MNSRKESVIGMMKAFLNAFGDGEFTMENISAFDTGTDSTAMQGKAIMSNVIAQTGATSGKEAVDMVEESFKGGVERFKGQLEHHYNPDFDPRDIVGDNYINPHEKLYGNNSVTGPDAFHGTHVAGIIAAVRGNDLGMDGVADNVRIMTIRCVPDGDERDKDVANSIRYAVDNGASVVNMSFGKSFSWNKEIVDDAVKYAAKHDVLLVHAAGNDSKNNDFTDNFPNDTYEKSFFLCPKSPKNWVEVGALDPRGNEKSVAGYSNYGNESVDVFAPGSQIYSTIPGSEYGNAQGTSMASPMVAGVAAVLRSYFPTLTARQVKEILIKSSDKRDIKVIKPGSEEEVHFSELSLSDGMVNAYEAVKMAKMTKGKKKLKKSKA
jgi:subtilisin family serine protease